MDENSCPLAVAALCATAITAPATADTPTDGPVTVTLPACAQATPVTQAVVPGCSYVALPAKDGTVYYAHVTSGGAVTMSGSLSGGVLTLPASGQTWPAISLAGVPVIVQVARPTITGTLGSDGAVTLSVPYEATVAAGILGSCTIKGAATMSSAGSDAIGGGQGRAYDPATKAFAVAGTSAAPALQGTLCSYADQFLDLGRGVGWYLDGSLATATPTPAVRSQTAKVKWPGRIKRKGRTVLLTGPVATNAGRRPRPGAVGRSATRKVRRPRRS
ncbi:MAG: hypothetical protein IPG68_01745 [Micrococcales bacterium]|nr:hypothetical protein [Micrococcales bacterium]